MNDSELEDELRALRPAQPSIGLEQRITRELAAAPAGCVCAGVREKTERRFLGERLLRDLGWAGAGASAVLAGLALFPPPNDAPMAATTAPAVQLAQPEATFHELAFEPAGATSELLAATDSDQVLETDDGPVREVRYRFRERHAWTDPSTGARMEVEVPRVDVYLVPVSLQ